MTVHDRYSSPLSERYASRAMLELWSPQTRHGLWRQLWLALAEAEQQLGVPIPDDADIHREVDVAIVVQIGHVEHVLGACQRLRHRRPDLGFDQQLSRVKLRSKPLSIIRE